MSAVESMPRNVSTSTRSASASARIPLRHPTPDLQTLKGAYVQNVQRLERSAEELSAGGSDIGEEIRKMNESSRQSSYYSFSQPGSPHSLRKASSRCSTGHASNAFVTSPTWSRPSVDRITSAPLHHQPFYQPAQQGVSTEFPPWSSPPLNSWEEREGAIPDAAPSCQRPISSSTFQHAQTAFHDFDGAHFTPHYDQNGHEIPPPSQRYSSSTITPSLLRAPYVPNYPPAMPRLGQDMVYYPAPVPKILNFPKKLSQLPAASVQSKRRAELANQATRDLGDTASWHSSENGDHNDSRTASFRTSTSRGLDHRLNSSAANLAPQARAELFFSRQAIKHDIQLPQSGSAVAALDEMLAASALAPAHGFGFRHYQDAPNKNGAGEAMHRPTSSLSGPLGKAASSLSVPSQASDDGARSTGPKKLQKRRSRMDLETESVETRSQTSTATDERPLTADTEHKSQHGDEELPTETIFAKPSTLIAELQVRKAQQKSRSRTAATAYPNGMYSTLLELDAVEEVARRNRKAKRIALAWEDPEDGASLPEAEDENENLPLGMLYRSKDAEMLRAIGPMKDWERPVGLLERRQLEDAEPLSARKNRLNGIAPGSIRSGLPGMQSQVSLNGNGAIANQQEDEEETLAQRQKRIRSLNVPGETAPVAPQATQEAAFPDDVLSRFAEFDIAIEPAQNTAKAADLASTADEGEEETLTQRKARLQRDRQASGKPFGTTAGFATAPYRGNGIAVQPPLSSSIPFMPSPYANQPYIPPYQHQAFYPAGPAQLPGRLPAAYAQSLRAPITAGGGAPEEQMDGVQRAAIDHWRATVGPS